MSTSTEYPFPKVPPAEAIARYRAICADRPMTKTTMPFGGDVWVVHRNAAARELLGDTRFVREPFRTGERVVPYFVEFPDFLKSTIQFADPPEHTKLRRLVMKAISPKSIKAIRDSAVAYANELIDEMLAQGNEADLVSAYALGLPIQMISNLLGVPPEDRPKFEKWASSTLSVSGMSEDEIATNMIELVVYTTAMIEERRKEPREDMLSLLANAQDADDTLSNDEILAMAITFIVAGFDNTANFINIGVLSLLNNPDQRDLFVADPDTLAPTAVEEILRHGRMEMGLPMEGSGGLVPFVATEDVVLDGQLVAKGEAVLVDPSGAAHDGIALEADEKFDITRANNPHLTLSYGMHHCLGAPLARMELQVALAELFKRIPQIRLNGEAHINTDHLSQPVATLPVAW